MPIEHDKALARVIVGVMKDDTELFKQYSDNPDFKRWLADTVFGMTYDGARAGGNHQGAGDRRGIRRGARGGRGRHRRCDV
jgi:hypothetical protein